MNRLIIASLLGCVLAHPQGYNVPRIIPSGGGFSSGGFIGGGGGFSGGFSGGFDNSNEVSIGGGSGGGFGGGCGTGQVRHVDGSCVQPEVTRNVFVYSAPNLPVNFGPTPPIPQPRVEYNVVFVRTPEGPQGVEPIVVPPPQQKTIVYVLTKNGQVGQQVIEVPAGPNQSPEVFYVNYNDGDNPQLPGGISLQEALSAAVSQDGQLIGRGGGFGSGFGAGISSGSFGGGISDGNLGGGFIGGVAIGNVGGFINGGNIGGDGGVGKTYSAP